MTRLPAARTLLAGALTTSALLTVGACSGMQSWTAPRAAPASRGATAPVTAPPSATASPALTEAQARSALITEVDLGEPWAPMQGTATWRDGLLKAKAPDDRPDCQRLLEGLYTDELLGAPARAVVGLDGGYAQTQLRYQVTAQRPADVDRTLAWLKTLPEKCGTFTAVTAGGATQEVEVFEAELPEVGDARQGLRVVLTGEQADEPSVLTVDVAAVRVGVDALTLTNGGLGEVYNEITTGVTELGAQRLAEVRKQARAEV
ncbi:hypothetical protein ADL00_04275 [Streptomyces sp. AS58]|uniref:hypothetical protein n=1 Tax=Streptomyces TaxID=1883 RepID=UPI0006B02DFC|nr:hypothetical protein [Streptomyces sp. AS58]KOV73783.1 hypothetical protein ADL00_04275 [Streptomyces sp. AS58]